MDTIEAWVLEKAGSRFGCLPLLSNRYFIGFFCKVTDSAYITHADEPVFFCISFTSVPFRLAVDYCVISGYNQDRRKESFAIYMSRLKKYNLNITPICPAQRGMRI